MSSQFHVKLNSRHRAALASSLCAVVLFATIATAEPLRSADTSITVVYGPLWLTIEAGLSLNSPKFT